MSPVAQRVSGCPVPKLVGRSSAWADDTFVGIAYVEVTKYPACFFEKYIALTCQRPQGPVLVMGSCDTTLKRRKLIDEAMPRVEPLAGNFSTQRAWEDVGKSDVGHFLWISYVFPYILPPQSGVAVGFGKSAFGFPYILPLHSHTFCLSRVVFATR